MFKTAIIILAISVSVPALFPQNTGGPPTPPIPAPTPSTVPAEALYRAFFRHVQALEQAANNIESTQGRNASDLHNYYRTAIGLTDQQTALLKQIAATCNGAVQAQNLKAQQAIQTARALSPSRQVASLDAMPAPPASLAALESGRKTITANYMQTLRTSLGPDAFSRLDTYVRTKFAPNVSTVPVVQHRPTGRTSLGALTPIGGTN